MTHARPVQMERALVANQVFREGSPYFLLEQRSIAAKTTRFERSSRRCARQNAAR